MPRPLQVTNCLSPHAPLSHRTRKWVGWLQTNAGLANTLCQSSPIATFYVFPCIGGRIVAAVKAHARAHERKGRVGRILRSITKSRERIVASFLPPSFFQPSSLLFFNIDGSRAWKAYDTTFRTRTYTFPSSFCPPAPREEVERSLPDQKYSPRASRHPRRGFRGTERGEGTSIRR